MSTSDEIHETGWLLNLPPNRKQRLVAIVVAAALFIGFGILAPFAARPVPHFDSFVPAVAATISVIDFITSVLLFAHFSIYPSRALLALASGYLFVAFAVIANALTYPGAFSPTGLFGAGLQSAGWFYFFWHISFAAALLGYSWLKEEKPTNRILHSSPSFAIGWAITIVFGVAGGLTWLAIGGESFLPKLLQDRTHIAPAARYALVFMLLFGATALAVLWARRRSVLDQWLIVVTLSLISELAFTLIGGGRLSLGAYANRVFSLATSTILLVVLLAETTKLYSRVARANMMLRREQNNKLMNLGAVTSSISHEVRQPLAAIASNTSAALRFLGHKPPNLEEVQDALNRIATDRDRITGTLENLRALFGKQDTENNLVDVNEIALEALQVMRWQLRGHRIFVLTHLTSELPAIVGNKGQLQEVIINLIQNAIDAMQEVKDERHVLQVKAEHTMNEVNVTVQDSGPGIPTDKIDAIFDPFVTTKRDGMGLGLAISRTIVERHGGQLTVLPVYPHGSVLRMALPIAPDAAPSQEEVKSQKLRSPMLSWAAWMWRTPGARKAPPDAVVDSAVQANENLDRTLIAVELER
jgi:signal transduction histidine kinase